MTHADLIVGPDLTTAAKNIRRELASAFPGVKFSVRSRRFAGGDAIDIGWTDGPTSDRVQKIADKYADGDFDGMDDSYHYRSGKAAEFTQKHGGAKYVHTRRQTSPALVARAIDAVAQRFGDAHRPTPEEFLNGHAWNRSPMDNAPPSWDWQSLIHRELATLAG